MGIGDSGVWRGAELESFSIAYWSLGWMTVHSHRR